MTAESFPALLICLQHRAVNIPCILFKPGKQRWAEIEADLRVVVDDAGDAPLRIHDSGRGVGRVAFRGNTLVPIVIWISRLLQFDVLKRRVLPWRLVEMTVNADVSHRRESEVRAYCIACFRAPRIGENSGDRKSI